MTVGAVAAGSGRGRRRFALTAGPFGGFGLLAADHVAEHARTDGGADDGAGVVGLAAGVGVHLGAGAGRGRAAFGLAQHHRGGPGRRRGAAGRLGTAEEGSQQEEDADCRGDEEGDGHRLDSFVRVVVADGGLALDRGRLIRTTIGLRVLLGLQLLAALHQVVDVAEHGEQTLLGHDR